MEEAVCHCGFGFYFPDVSDVKHFSIYLLITCIFSFENHLLKFFTHSQLDFFLLNFSWYIWDVFCQICSLQISFPVAYLILLIRFYLLLKSFWVWYNPICFCFPYLNFEGLIQELRIPYMSVLECFHTFVPRKLFQVLNLKLWFILSCLVHMVKGMDLISVLYIYTWSFSSTIFLWWCLCSCSGWEMLRLRGKGMMPFWFFSSCIWGK